MTSTDAPSTPPEARGFVARMKASATLLTAVTGLVIAVGAAVKPRDDSATRESYDTLAKSVQDIGRENETQHDDLVALKAYLDGFLRASSVNSGQWSVRADAGATPSAPSSAPSSPNAAAASAAPPLPASPKLADKPKPVTPPPFREIREKADLH